MKTTTTNGDANGDRGRRRGSRLGYRTVIEAVCGHEVSNPVMIGHADDPNGNKFPVCIDCVRIPDVRDMVMVRWAPQIEARSAAYEGPRAAERKRQKAKIIAQREAEKEQAKARAKLRAEQEGMIF